MTGKESIKVKRPSHIKTRMLPNGRHADISCLHCHEVEYFENIYFNMVKVIEDIEAFVELHADCEEST